MCVSVSVSVSVSVCLCLCLCLCLGGCLGGRGRRVSGRGTRAVVADSDCSLGWLTRMADSDG